MLITIQSNARRDTEADEPVTLVTSGQLILEDQKATLRYDETLDESLPPQHVTIVLENDSLIMSRNGDYATEIVFQKGNRYEGQYATPFGSMALAVFCTRLRYELNDEGGEIFLSYQMDLNGQFAAMHQLEMRLMKQNG